MIALLEAKRAGLLQRRHWPQNLVAGVIVGIVALPLAMAFAIASGARPEQGIYTAIVAALLVSVFGGSRVQIAGPTGAFIAILSGVTLTYGIDGLQLATMMAGVILVALGAAKLGRVIRFIPQPVIVGFTSGIGVIIFVGQWREFLGLPKVGGQHFHEKLLHLLLLLPQANLKTVVIGAASLALLLACPRIKRLARIPAPLIAMAGATALAQVAGWSEVATIGTAFGGIPVGLPRFQLPELSVGRILTLIGPAFTIAMLGAIESLLSAVVADGMAGTRHDPNQELIGQGIANVVAPMFGGFAATGAIARTATSIRNGASSPLAGITHSATLVAILVALAPLASSIPLASLAAILFVVAWNMSEAHHFVYIARSAPAADRVILLTTFLLTVFADLVVAVNVGVILAVLQFMRRMAESVETRESDSLEVERLAGRVPKDVVVYEIEGPLFFGAVENFEHALRTIQAKPHAVIIRMPRVPFVDITGLRVLDDVVKQFRRRGITVILSEMNDRVRGKAERSGLIATLGPEHVAATLNDALACVPGA